MRVRIFFHFWYCAYLCRTDVKTCENVGWTTVSVVNETSVPPKRSRTASDPKQKPAADRFEPIFAFKDVVLPVPASLTCLINS